MVLIKTAKTNLEWKFDDSSIMVSFREKGEEEEETLLTVLNFIRMRKEINLDALNCYLSC